MQALVWGEVVVPQAAALPVALPEPAALRPRQVVVPEAALPLAAVQVVVVLQVEMLV